MRTDSSTDFGDLLNSRPEGWLEAMGIRFVVATAEEVVAEWEVDSRHHQAYGIVHGGVHCGVIETVASVGAALFALPHDLAVVGLENHTSFIRAVRSGRLRCTGTPVTRGRRTQVWEATIRDDQGRTVATGRVRLLCVESETPIAGETVTRPSYLP